MGLALRGAPLREFRRGDTEVPVWVRFAGADDYGTEDLARLHRARARWPQRAAAGDGQRAACAGRDYDRTHQPPDHADDHRRTSPTRSRSPTRKAIEETLKGVTFPAGLQLHLRTSAVRATTKR